MAYAFRRENKGTPSFTGVYEGPMAAAGRLVYLALGMEGCSRSANSRVFESPTL